MSREDRLRRSPAALRAGRRARESGLWLGYWGGSWQLSRQDGAIIASGRLPDVRATLRAEERRLRTWRPG